MASSSTVSANTECGTGEKFVAPGVSRCLQPLRPSAVAAAVDEAGYEPVGTGNEAGGEEAGHADDGHAR